MIGWIRRVLRRRAREADPVVAELSTTSRGQAKEVRAAVRAANEVSRNILEDGYRKQDGYFKGSHR